MDLRTRRPCRSKSTTLTDVVPTSNARYTDQSPLGPGRLARGGRHDLDGGSGGPELLQHRLGDRGVGQHPLDAVERRVADERVAVELLGVREHAGRACRAEHDPVQHGRALVGGHEPAREVDRVGAEECPGHVEEVQRLLGDRPAEVAPLRAHLAADEDHLAPPGQGLDEHERVGEHDHVRDLAGLQAQRQRLRQLQHRGARVEVQPVPGTDELGRGPAEEGLLAVAVRGGEEVGVVGAEVRGEAHAAVRADHLPLAVEAREEAPHRGLRDVPATRRRSARRAGG